MHCNESLVSTLSDYLSVDLTYSTWMKHSRVEKKLHGLDFNTGQLFWLAYGTSMCSELNQSLRIVGSLSNSLYFGKDFKCDMNRRNKCLIL